MKVEARVFEICAGFFFLCAIVYSLLAKEPVGSAGLYLVGGLGLIIGTYFRFVSRRLRPRPEDDPEADVADGAGDLGFFSPGSYWPIGVAGAATLLGGRTFEIANRLAEQVRRRHADVATADVRADDETGSRADHVGDRVAPALARAAARRMDQPSVLEPAYSGRYRWL